MKRNKKRVLFIFGGILSPFKQKDRELLGKHFDVRVIKYEVIKYKDYPRVLLKLLRAVFWADVTFSWFAGEHAMWAVRLSKILRKKSIVVVGGGEVANVPEIGYGSLLDPTGARIVKYVLNNADKLLAVSEFNKKEILKYTTPKNVELVYNGVDCDKFQPNGEKEDLVITVAHTISNGTIETKGLETFIKSAGYLPNTLFLVVGELLDSSAKRLKSTAPSNVKFRGFVPQEDLLKYYQKAKVYCQLSYRESFGMALAEAMACECVPVVTNDAALPEVVGDTGFYVPYDDPEATAEAIKEALKSDKEKEARERIKEMFPIEKREKELARIIKEM